MQGMACCSSVATHSHCPWPSSGTDAPTVNRAHAAPRSTVTASVTPKPRRLGLGESGVHATPQRRWERNAPLRSQHGSMRCATRNWNPDPSMQDQQSQAHASEPACSFHHWIVAFRIKLHKGYEQRVGHCARRESERHKLFTDTGSSVTPPCGNFMARSL